MHLQLLAAILVVALAAACSNTKPASPDDQDDQGGTVDDGMVDDGQAFGEENEPVDDGGFGGCGYDSFGDSVSLLGQTLSSAKIRLHGFAGEVFSTEYTIYAKGSLAFSGGLDTVTTTSNFSVLSADPANTLSKAEQEARKINGSRAAKVVDADDWEELLKDDSAWSGLHCTILPVDEIVERTGSHATTVEFDPPLPYLVPPTLSTKRFAKEFPSARSFSGIKAKVKSTSNSKISSGRTFTGEVTITPVSPSATFTDTEGRQVSVNAGYAFRVEFNFGTHQTTGALGLYKVATYYAKNGKYLAITVESGIKDAPIVNFLKQ